MWARAFIFAWTILASTQATGLLSPGGQAWLSPFEPASLSSSSPTRLPLPEDELQAHGTTTLAFMCKEGIVLAVDSRASIGKYVGSRTTRKVFPMSRHMVATMAGGAADCTYWIRLCTRIAKLHEYNAGAPLSVASVATMIAKRLREMRSASEFLLFVAHTRR